VKVYTLQKEQYLSVDRDTVFAFFERPENLARITPTSLSFRILTPSPIAMHTGAVIDYTIKVMGISNHWRTLITDYTPPHSFVDQQQKGPYALWHHRHDFESVSDGGTLIRDTVTYALPFGIFGRIAHALFVRPQLTHIFDYRSRVIADLLADQ
jgi:ligand-binding SRPBCC domain-containing protein